MAKTPVRRCSRRRRSGLGRLGCLGCFRADVEDGRNAPELGSDRRRALRAVLDVGREHPADGVFELRGDGGVQASQHLPSAPAAGR